MARQLWILRHGEAEPHGTRPDEERRLTARGEAQARAAGRALVRLEVPVHEVHTSPKERALRTALLACEALDTTPQEHAPLRSGFSAQDALELVEVAGDHRRVVVVGHEPDLSQVVLDLTGARVELKKGGLAAVRLRRATRGELLVLLRPRELARIATPS